MGYDTVSTLNLTKELGISKGTLHRWESEYGVNVGRDENDPNRPRIYTEEIANTFREIKKLRSQRMNSEDIKIRLNLGVSGFQHGNNYPPNIEVITQAENTSSNELEVFVKNILSKYEEGQDKIDMLRDQVDREREEKADLKIKNAEISAHAKYLQMQNHDLEEKLAKAQRKRFFGLF